MILYRLPQFCVNIAIDHIDNGEIDIIALTINDKIRKSVTLLTAYINHFKSEIEI